MICAGFVSGTALAETINFDDAKAGAPPPGWKSAVTGSGSAKWSVEQDSSAPSKPNVLKQSGVGTFPICIYESAKLKDGSVEIKFKPIEGKEDQAGGVIWRVQDSNNYYIARANALEAPSRWQTTITACVSRLIHLEALPTASAEIAS